MSKDKIRPIYSELQGYLSQAPEVKHSGEMLMDEPGFWNHYNSAIDELNSMKILEDRLQGVFSRQPAVICEESSSTFLV